MQKIILKVDAGNYENIILHLNKMFKSNVTITETNQSKNDNTDFQKSIYKEYAHIDIFNMKQLDDVLLSR